jgi:hypothetical protein
MAKLPPVSGPVGFWTIYHQDGDKPAQCRAEFPENDPGAEEKAWAEYRQIESGLVDGAVILFDPDGKRVKSKYVSRRIPYTEK